MLQLLLQYPCYHPMSQVFFGLPSELSYLRFYVPFKRGNKGYLKQKMRHVDYTRSNFLCMTRISTTLVEYLAYVWYYAIAVFVFRSYKLFSSSLKKPAFEI